MTAREGAAPGQAAVSPLEALALRMDKIAADHQAEAERPLSDGVKYRALAAQDRVWAKLLREAMAAAAAAQPGDLRDLAAEVIRAYAAQVQYDETERDRKRLEDWRARLAAAAQPAPGGTHIGRSWDGHDLEDECPCPKAPCGLVVQETAAQECDEHPLSARRTIRQSHRADQCPAGQTAPGTDAARFRDVVCKLLDLYGAPDNRLMQHSSVTRATLQRYAGEAGVRLDGRQP